MTDQGIITRLINEADAHLAARERLYMECSRLTGVVEVLKDQLAAATSERAHAVSALSEDADKLRAERDEARRMYCEAVILHGTAHRINESDGLTEITDAGELARKLGWDCYKEDANAQGQ